MPEKRQEKQISVGHTQALCAHRRRRWFDIGDFGGGSELPSRGELVSTPGGVTAELFAQPPPFPPEDPRQAAVGSAQAYPGHSAYTYHVQHLPP